MYEIADYIGDFQWRYSNQTVGAVGWSQIVRPDPRRVLIRIQGPGSQSLMVNPVDNLNLSPPMILIAPGTDEELFWARHGIMCIWEYWGMLPAASGPVQICVTEVFWVPSTGG